MIITADISLYPLSDDYKHHIVQFIEQLNSEKELKVITNGMSTQLFGEYDLVMNTISSKLKPIFAEKDKFVCVVKYINSDRSK